jgi:two-component sensor histidine kinase
VISSGISPDSRALDRVLLLAPYRRDAEYLASLIAEHDIEPVEVTGSRLTATLDEGAGVVVATHEALTQQVITAVSRHLADQPAWAELPIVLLLDRSSPNGRIRSELAERWPRARLLYYERPVSAVELISGIQSALLVRLRQREVARHIDAEVELRRELNHRVKNILASVVSIFQMTRRGATSLEELNEDFEGRLQALSNVHSAVFQASGEAVSIGAITELTFAPYRGKGAGRVKTAGPEISLTGESSTTLALCLHELTTNALKYGALSNPSGIVTFEWSLSDEDLVICWKESGGPPVVAPVRTGYGTRYLRSALASLFGERPRISFEADGFLCEARGPAHRIVGTF